MGLTKAVPAVASGVGVGKGITSTLIGTRGRAAVTAAVGGFGAGTIRGWFSGGFGAIGRLELAVGVGLVIAAVAALEGR